MSATSRVTNWVLRRVFQTICRIDTAAFKQIPRTGPLIIVSNHVNFLEAPVILPHLDNPTVTGLAKKESWDNPLFHFLFNQWGFMPLDRDAIDRDAFRLSIQVLNEGKILGVAPEGTRSKTGALLPGKPGVAVIALRSGAPMLPMATFGYENFWPNLKRLRRTDFHVAVGKPFRLAVEGSTLSRDIRQAVTDEIMFKIAELLPEKYRGHYAFEGAVEYRYLEPL